MKKLLVVTPRFPYPVVGGDRLRIYQQCKVLSQHYRLTLLSLCESRAELDMLIPIDGVFDRIERIWHPKWRAWLQAFLALFTKQPLQVAYYKSSVLSDRLQALAPSHDGIFLHLVRMLEAVHGVEQIKFLEMTDAISLGYQRIGQVDTRGQPGLLPWIYRLEKRRMRKYETQAALACDHSFMVSAVDRDYLFGSGSQALDKVSIVANGVDLNGLPYQFTPEGQDLVFIGNMQTLPNQDAVRYLVTKVMPLLATEFPEMRLRVIGRASPRILGQFNQYPKVIATGEVSSVAKASFGAGVGICPMRLGAGVQNKLLEYMALGLPSVSSSIGIEGLQAEPGRHLLLADSPEQMASAIRTLLKNRALAQKLAQAARSYVESQHPWHVALKPMLQVIENTLNAVQQRSDHSYPQTEQYHPHLGSGPSAPQ